MSLTPTDLPHPVNQSDVEAASRKHSCAPLLIASSQVHRAPVPDAMPSRETVLRELLDDSHARLRELRRALQAVKDALTF